MFVLKHRFTRTILWISAAILLFGVGVPLLPADASPPSNYYVSPDGNDSAPGTFEQPWRTVQHAVDRANPGDTINLRAGIYGEGVSFHQSGLEESPITLTGYGGEAVTIDGKGNPALLDLDGTQYWIIQGLTLASNAEHTLLLDAWGCNGTCGGTHHWTIRNNTIIGAVHIYGSYNLFEENEVDGSQHKGSENGVLEEQEASHHNIFRHNDVHNFNVRGIWSMHRTHDDLFESNYVHDIGDSTEGMCIDIDGFASVEWRHTVRNNRLHHCGESGIELENTFDSLVENNTIHDTGRIGIDIINYGPGLGPGTTKCEPGGESNQYGDTDGDNDCRGDRTGNTIRQNLIYHGAQNAAILIYYAGDVRILGNTIYKPSGNGIYVNSGTAFCPDIQIRSNIVADSGEAGISIEEVSSLDQDDHNLLFRSAAGIVYEIRHDWIYYTLSQYQENTSKGQASIQADPRFVDPGGNNFHLQDISPAVDAGADVGSTQDLDGNSRPEGGGYDIGVYESSAFAPTATLSYSATPLPPSPMPPPSATSLPASPIPQRSATAQPPPSSLGSTAFPAYPTEETSTATAPTSPATTQEAPPTILTVTPARFDSYRDSAEGHSATEGGYENGSIFSVVWGLVVKAFEWLANLPNIAIPYARRILG
jgi:parallel beta-helix repeat protein